MAIPPVLIQLYLSQTVSQMVESVTPSLQDGRCAPITIESIPEPMVILRLRDAQELAELLQDETIKQILDDAQRQWEAGRFVKLKAGETPPSIQEIMADPGFTKSLAEGLDDWDNGRVSRR